MGALDVGHLKALRNMDAFLDEVACRMLDAYLSGSITYASLDLHKISSWLLKT
jgi:hypothetical protein